MPRKVSRLAVVSEDFDDLMPFFQANGLLVNPAPPQQLSNARRIHQATYSLIQWSFRLKGLPPHSKPFIEEIASDALHILPHTLAGHTKSAKLMTRGIIENVLRHVYFADHPIEFLRMNQERKWFMTQDALMDYARIHPLLSAAEARFPALAKLANLYSDLSGGIHGRTVSHMQMKIALEHIGYDNDAATEQTNTTSQCAEAANYILAAFHKSQVQGFAVDDRRVILRTMAKEARRAWGDL